MKPCIKIAIIVAIFAGLSTGATCPRRDHDSVFSTENLLAAKAEHLEKTVVTPHLEHPIEAGKNVLWCSTFQLAWNEACELFGEDIHLVDEPPMVAILNKKTATKSDLDKESYVAMAGFIRDGIIAKIRKALGKKFKGEATPRLLKLVPQATVVRPQDIVMYAYLFKNLEYTKPFEKIDTPILFKDTEVECYGVDYQKSAPEEMLSQVHILDYKNEDDFVIELKSKSKGDRIIMAKIAPQATLESTVSAVNKRIDGVEPVPMMPFCVLKAPKLNFDITREYSELCGGWLRVKNPQIAKDLLLLIAMQNIRFQMDEKGVKLRSEAVGGFGCSAVPGAGLVMIFDKPFLIMLKRADRKVPYFALWVDNAELLVKAED